MASYSRVSLHAPQTFAANALPCFNATDPNQAFSETKRIDDDTQEDILLGVRTRHV